MAKLPRITVSLTESQLYDVINCLRHCIDRGIGYGHVTTKEQCLRARHREVLLDLFKRMAPREVT
jgi:hypothetical protein